MLFLTVKTASFADIRFLKAGFHLNGFVFAKCENNSHEKTFVDKLICISLRNYFSFAGS